MLLIVLRREHCRESCSIVIKLIYKSLGVEIKCVKHLAYGKEVLGDGAKVVKFHGCLKL